MPTVSYSLKTTWSVNPTQCFGHPFPPVVSITLNNDLPSVHQVCWHVRQNQSTRYMGISFVIEPTDASQTGRATVLGLSTIRVQEGRPECKENRLALLTQRH